MMTACPAPDARLGLVQGLISTVDCGVRGFAQAGYQSLTQPPSPLPALITAALTIYVALLGWGLMTGRGPRLADAPQLAVKIGVILALSTSWPLFQTLVFRTAFDGAEELARAVTATLPLQGGSPWTALQSAYDQIVAAAAHYGAQAGPEADPRQGGAALAAESLWIASTALLATTLYVALAGKVMVGGLTAVGPLFILLFMIAQTRGLFAGWLRALLVSALLPLLAALSSSLLLLLLQPQLALLAQAITTGQVDLGQIVGLTSLVLAFGLGTLGLVAAAAVTGISFRIEPLAPPAATPASASSRPEPAAPQSRAATVAAGVEAAMVRERLESRSQSVERRIAAPGGASASSPAAAAGSNFPSASPIGRRLRKEGFR